MMFLHCLEIGVATYLHTRELHTHTRTHDADTPMPTHLELMRTR